MIQHYEENRADLSIVKEILYTSRDVISNPIIKTTSNYERFFNGKTNEWKSNLLIGHNHKIINEDIFENLSQKEIYNWKDAISSNHEINVNLRYEERIRRYFNSEGVNQESLSLWIDIQANCKINGHNYYITDASPSKEDVVPKIDSILKEIEQTHNDYLRYSYINPLLEKYTLLLDPTVSAVFFHELIGHGTEEIQIDRLPFKIGPNNLKIKVINPTKESYDDEGILIKGLPLVKDGILFQKAYDRKTSYLIGAIPSGLCQVDSHSGDPLPRLTHLVIDGGKVNKNDMCSELNKGIYCKNINGAEFYENIAIIYVKNGYFIEKGEIVGLVPPFQFMVDMNMLDNHIMCIANDSQYGRSGRCVKEFNSIPTMTKAPSVLLKDINIIW